MSTASHAWHSKRGVSQVKFSVSYLPRSLLSLSGDEGDRSFAAASWLSALKPVTCEVGSAALNAAIAFKTLGVDSQRLHCNGFHLLTVAHAIHESFRSFFFTGDVSFVSRKMGREKRSKHFTCDAFKTH